MQLALQHNMEKIGFSFIFSLIILFYVIKEICLELEGVLVSGCEFACMLNRNPVKTNQMANTH